MPASSVVCGFNGTNYQVGEKVCDADGVTPMVCTIDGTFQSSASCEFACESGECRNARTCTGLNNTVVEHNASGCMDDTTVAKCIDGEWDTTNQIICNVDNAANSCNTTTVSCDFTCNDGYMKNAAGNACEREIAGCNFQWIGETGAYGNVALNGKTKDDYEGRVVCIDQTDSTNIITVNAAYNKDVDSNVEFGATDLSAIGAGRYHCTFEFKLASSNSWFACQGVDYGNQWADPILISGDDYSALPASGWYRDYSVQLCTPNARVCEGTDSYKVCASDGMSYGTAVSCGTDAHGTWSCSGEGVCALACTSPYTEVNGVCECTGDYVLSNGDCIAKCTTAQNSCSGDVYNQCNTTSGLMEEIAKPGDLYICEDASGWKSVDCIEAADCTAVAHATMACNNNACEIASCEGNWSPSGSACVCTGDYVVSGDNCIAISSVTCEHDGTDYLVGEHVCNADGKTPMVCTVDGVFQADGTCEFACEAGACREARTCTGLDNTTVAHNAAGCKDETTVATCIDGAWDTDNQTICNVENAVNSCNTSTAACDFECNNGFAENNNACEREIAGCNFQWIGETGAYGNVALNGKTKDDYEGRVVCIDQTDSTNIITVNAAYNKDVDSNVEFGATDLSAIGAGRYHCTFEFKLASSNSWFACQGVDYGNQWADPILISGDDYSALPASGWYREYQVQLCTPNARACEGTDSYKVCASDGMSYGTAVSCGSDDNGTWSCSGEGVCALNCTSPYIEDNGACVCTATSNSCTDNNNGSITVVTCESTGLYSTQTLTDKSCKSATEVGECLNNDTNCVDGEGVYTCADGVWGTAAPCEYGCNAAGKACQTVSEITCDGGVAIGTETCDGSRLKTCTLSGSEGIFTYQDCASGCENNACRVCIEDAQECVSDTEYRICMGNAWETDNVGAYLKCENDEIVCAVEGESCVGDVYVLCIDGQALPENCAASSMTCDTETPGCVYACKNGEIRCTNETTYQECVDHAWTDKTIAAEDQAYLKCENNAVVCKQSGEFCNGEVHVMCENGSVLAEDCSSTENGNKTCSDSNPNEVGCVERGCDFNGSSVADGDLVCMDDYSIGMCDNGTVEGIESCASGFKCDPSTVNSAEVCTDPIDSCSTVSDCMPSTTDYNACINNECTTVECYNSGDEGSYSEGAYGAWCDAEPHYIWKSCINHKIVETKCHWGTCSADCAQETCTDGNYDPYCRTAGDNRTLAIYCNGGLVQVTHVDSCSELYGDQNQASNCVSGNTFIEGSGKSICVDGDISLTSPDECSSHDDCTDSNAPACINGKCDICTSNDECGDGYVCNEDTMDCEPASAPECTSGQTKCGEGEDANYVYSCGSDSKWAKALSACENGCGINSSNAAVCLVKHEFELPYEETGGNSYKNTGSIISSNNSQVVLTYVGSTKPTGNGAGHFAMNGNTDSYNNYIEIVGFNGIKTITINGGSWDSSGVWNNSVNDVLLSDYDIHLNSSWSPMTIPVNDNTATSYKMTPVASSAKKRILVDSISVLAYE